MFLEKTKKNMPEFGKISQNHRTGHNKWLWRVLSSRTRCHIEQTTQSHNSQDSSTLHIHHCENLTSKIND
jgi:hypothetical protein